MRTEDQKEITVIPAKQEYGRVKNLEKKKLKVAAYCRVSTAQEKQENSYMSQIMYYSEQIKSNLEWHFVGVYADEGITGTSTKNRNDFKKLIVDCNKGKIDLILTKSISRFARNTVDLLQTIRKLKENNIGVYFEKENINTLDATGEILITILSSLAQEESRNLSENIKWGIVRKFERGVVMVNHNRFMGYTKDARGDLVIVPEEAEIVRLIFRLFLQGKSSLGIKKELEKLKIKTATGQDIWHSTVIEKMLQNEKYMGHALLQKTYTVDYLTKKRIDNNGIVPQYYIKNSHEPIISEEIFYEVQGELKKRSKIRKVKRKYSSKYALTNIMYCNECGDVYRRVTWSRNGKKKIIWRCKNRLQNGIQGCGTSCGIVEEDLHVMVAKGIEKNKVDKNNNEVIVNMSEVDDRCIYDDIIVRKMIERIEICGKESIKILFKQ